MIAKTFDELIITVKAGHEPPRPEWHRWVYGGGRNPLLDVRFTNTPADALLRLVTGSGQAHLGKNVKNES